MLTYGGKGLPSAPFATNSTHHRSKRRPRGGLAKTAEDQVQMVAIVERPLDAADERQFIGDPGLQRHQLRNVKARNVGLNRLELAANLGRRLRLEVVHVEVTRPAVQADHDDRLARRAVRRRRLRAQPQQIGQRERSAQEPNMQEIAAADAIAEPLIWAPNGQHKRALRSGKWVLSAWACLLPGELRFYARRLETTTLVPPG